MEISNIGGRKKMVKSVKGILDGNAKC